MELRNTMIYLLGAPGTGKYTIAKEIAAGEGFRVVDNHLINNPVFSLIRADGKTKLPERVWDYTARIFDVVADTMVNLSPPEANFVLTNALAEDDPLDHEIYRKVLAIAEKREALFVPVRLEISDLAEHVRRITAPDRGPRLKETDGEAPRRYAGRQILSPAHPNVMTLDVSVLTPAGAAARILDHARQAAS